MTKSEIRISFRGAGLIVRNSPVIREFVIRHSFVIRISSFVILTQHFPNGLGLFLDTVESWKAG